MTEQVEVAIVGGGPAGSALAARLAGAGREVVVLERAPAWRWRACGVFSSPATIAALRDLGLDAVLLATVARPIPALRLEAPGGAEVRLAYGDDGSLTAPAVGFDRAGLDPALLALARARGAHIWAGTTVRATRPRARRSIELELDGPDGRRVLSARIVVGADGSRSIVARSAGVARRPPLAGRIGLTFHLRDRVTAPHDARMVVLDDGYVGLAPVPGNRVNVGIVLGRRWRDRVRRDGAREIAAAIVRRVDGAADVEPCDHVAGAAPLASRVARRAGRDWLLVGDAAGFLDPFTGEGLHRALVSTEFAADAIDAALRGASPDLDPYERAMRARFATKDAVSLVVQAFLGRPALFDYAARRLAARDRVRETMGLVIGDLVPASRALDPRFLAALLRP